MNQFTLKFCVHCRAEAIANDAKAAVLHYKDETFCYHTELKETRMKYFNQQMENESTVQKLHERSRDEYKQYKKQIHSLQEQIKELKSEKEIKNK